MLYYLVLLMIFFTGGLLYFGVRLAFAGDPFSILLLIGAGIMLLGFYGWIKPERKRKRKQKEQGFKRKTGLHEGQGWMSDDFDEPLPDEFWLGSETDPLNMESE